MDRIKEKLHRIYGFLLENRRYNRDLQERYYQAVLLPRTSAKEKVVSLLYEVVNTQSMPRISNISKFFVSLYGSGRTLDTFHDFIDYLGEGSVTYASLYSGLRKQSGWGDKTASLFVKSVYHTHNKSYDERLRFWEDVPNDVSANDRFYLPVDSVILEIFKHIGGSRWTFTSINALLDKHYQGDEIEVWDDLWFWGYFTQKVSSGTRRLQWNPEKYWAYSCSDKSPEVIAEIEDQARTFISMLREFRCTSTTAR
jgi:hypothetical protein